MSIIEDKHWQVWEGNGKLKGGGSRPGKNKWVDHKLLFCQECRRGYEWGWTSSSSRGWVFHPAGVIPAIGKTKKICPECEWNI